MLCLNQLRILTIRCAKNRSSKLHVSSIDSLKSNVISISDEVRTGLIDNKAVVALESTIITHGMPYPNNVECAIKVEEEIRKQVLLILNHFALFCAFYLSFFCGDLLINFDCHALNFCKKENVGNHSVKSLNSCHSDNKN